MKKSTMDLFARYLVRWSCFLSPAIVAWHMSGDWELGLFVLCYFLAMRICKVGIYEKKKNA